MRVFITIDSKNPCRDWARDDAEWWLRHHVRDRCPLREDEHCEGREALTFDFMESLDTIAFSMRTAASGHQGWIV